MAVHYAQTKEEIDLCVHAIEASFTEVLIMGSDLIEWLSDEGLDGFLVLENTLTGMTLRFSDERTAFHAKMRYGGQ